MDAKTQPEIRWITLAQECMREARRLVAVVQFELPAEASLSRFVDQVTWD
jgi:hypothetical protein